MLTRSSERRTLENWVRRRSTAQGLALRARIVLACAQGSSNVAGSGGAAGRQLHHGPQVVCTGSCATGWMACRTSHAPGAPRTITDAQVEEVVVRTLEEVPAGGTHWSKRELAQQVGVSPTSVHRIWRAFGLQPWRTETFKISRTRC